MLEKSIKTDFSGMDEMLIRLFTRPKAKESVS